MKWIVNINEGACRNGIGAEHNLGGNHRKAFLSLQVLKTNRQKNFIFVSPGQMIVFFVMSVIKGVTMKHIHELFSSWHKASHTNVTTASLTLCDKQTLQGLLQVNYCISFTSNSLGCPVSECMSSIMTRLLILTCMLWLCP